MSHTSAETPNQKIEEAKKQVVVGGIYVHYKAPDQSYKVIAIGLQEATEESCVVYQALYGDKLTWVRNLSDWILQVSDKNGSLVPKFEHIAK